MVNKNGKKMVVDSEDIQHFFIVTIGENLVNDIVNLIFLKQVKDT